MSSNITLSAGVRQNLLSLQNTASMMSTTQNRLATGKKVNTALDNPTNFFTSSSLQSRANDLSSLLDSMSNGIKTLEAADNGLTAITTTVESMQSTLRQARQDKSFQSESYVIDSALDTSAVQNISFSGGSVGETAVDIALNSADTTATAATLTGTAAVADDAALQAFAGQTITVTAGSQTATYNITASSTKAELVSTLGANGFAASFDGTNHLALSRADGANFTASGTGATSLGFAGAGATSTDGALATTGAVASVDSLVASINSNTGLADKIRASNDNGKLRIENLSTSDLTVTGVGGGKVTGGSSETKIDGNDVRKNLVKQFNGLRDQLNKLSDDASFNGINLLHGDKLKITFNETGTSTIEIQAKDTAGNVRGIDTSDDSLNIAEVSNAQFDSDATIDGLLDNLNKAMSTLRSQASSFGSNLSAVENRQDFTKSMINTLQTGADNLTLADSNEEAANMLALQTRQQLASTALSLASQSDQAVLRLF